MPDIGLLRKFNQRKEKKICSNKKKLRKVLILEISPKIAADEKGVFYLLYLQKASDLRGWDNIR